MSNEITKMEKNMLEGLLLLAKEHNERLVELHNAVIRLTGAEGDACDHCSDAIYSDFTADKLLKKLKITVNKTTPTHPE